MIFEVHHFNVHPEGPLLVGHSQQPQVVVPRHGRRLVRKAMFYVLKKKEKKFLQLATTLGMSKHSMYSMSVDSNL